VRLMGFGHRVYKNFDPRAKIIAACAIACSRSWQDQQPAVRAVAEIGGDSAQDDYFVSRKLYPNVDFYSGIIYSALGIPRSMFTVMFRDRAQPPLGGTVQEMVSDPNMKIGPAAPAYNGSHTERLPAIDQALIDGGPSYACSGTGRAVLSAWRRCSRWRCECRIGRVALRRCRECRTAENAVPSPAGPWRWAALNGWLGSGSRHTRYQPEPALRAAMWRSSL